MRNPNLQPTKSGAEPSHTILIADDEAEIRKVIQDLAQRVLQVKTIEAETGQEALSLFAQADPDVVVTDIRMPEMDGVTLLKRIKDNNPLVPVILITGYPSIDIAIQGMKEGASDFLMKPFRLEELQVVLEKSLREIDLLRENRSLREEVQQKRAIEKLNDKLNRRVKEVTALYSFGEIIAANPLNRDMILSELIKMAKDVTLTKSISFFISNGSGSDLGLLIQDPEEPQGLVDRSIMTERKRIVMKAAKQKKPIRLEGVWKPSDPSYTHSSDMSIGRSQCAVPLLINGEVFGVIHTAEKIKGTDYDRQDVSFLEELAKRASLSLENKYLYHSVFDVLMSTLRSFVSIIEAKDPYTREHSQRVTAFSVLASELMGCTPEQIDTVRLAGQLHDVGKVGVRDMVLLKPGRLTTDEFEEIKAHPVVGEGIIAPIGFLPEERALIRHHHERWDGGGYPDGLRGKEIPLLARIISLADAFDAMTSDRPYRRKFTYREAYEEILRCSGKQFDPQVVDTFRCMYPELIAQEAAEMPSDDEE